MSTDIFPVPGPWRGRLLVVTRPRGGDWLDDEAKGWRRHDIDLVVSLLEEDEAAQLGLQEEAGAAEANGVRFISFPIPDRGVPESRGAVSTLLSELGNALERGENVAVHCRQSIGRAGMIAAGVLISAGASPEQAIETVSTARGLAIPETPEQLNWVRRLSSPSSVLS